MGTSVDSSTRLSSSMGSSEHSSTSSPLLEGSAGEYAAARTSEQVKEIMEQMMELKDKCASMEEEVMMVGAQNKKPERRTQIVVLKRQDRKIQDFLKVRRIWSPKWRALRRPSLT